MNNRKHISQFLLFENDSDVISNRETAIVKSGSTIHRIIDYKGIRFQLFLNKEEYNKIYKDFNNILKSRIHFYGGNYILLPTGSHLIIPISEFMGWKNENKSTWFDPFKFL